MKGKKQISLKENLETKKQVQNNLTKKAINDRGITLIALVVTIIVLLILAGVTITAVLGEGGIIERAQEAADKTKNAVDKENADFEKINSLISEYGGGAPQDPTDDPDKEPTTVQEAVDNNTTFKDTTKLTDENNAEVRIPGGFTIVTKEMDNTVEYENAKEYPTVKSGIVITDSVTTEDGKLKSNGNEFVWVPVDDPSTMYGIDSSDNTKYLGKLYSFSSSEATPLNWTDAGDGKISWTSNTSYREPDILDKYDTSSTNLNIVVEDKYKIDGTATKDGFKTQLQNEFKDMCDSVAKYKGFYIGRYETSLSEDSSESEDPKKSASKKGATSLTSNTTANNWYGQYKYNKAYAPKEENASVVSSTIWGSQYDAMMKWMKDNGIKVESTAPKDGLERNITRITGAPESNDKICNIYDLLGNSREYTLEAYSYIIGDGRAIRGR